MTRIITYQNGVDVLGNPTFVQHKIIQDNPTQTKREPKKRFVVVLQSLFKQY
jgi:hypothetical protein